MIQATESKIPPVENHLSKRTAVFLKRNESPMDSARVMLGQATVSADVLQHDSPAEQPGPLTFYHFLSTKPWGPRRLHHGLLDKQKEQVCFIKSIQTIYKACIEYNRIEPHLVTSENQSSPISPSEASHDWDGSTPSSSRQDFGSRTYARHLRRRATMREA